MQVEGATNESADLRSFITESALSPIEYGINVWSMYGTDVMHAESEGCGCGGCGCGCSSCGSAGDGGDGGDGGGEAGAGGGGGGLGGGGSGGGSA